MEKLTEIELNMLSKYAEDFEAGKKIKMQANVLGIASMAILLGSFIVYKRETQALISVVLLGLGLIALAGIPLIYYFSQPQCQTCHGQWQKRSHKEKTKLAGHLVYIYYICHNCKKYFRIKVKNK